jgi:hypothetical protein
LQLRSLAALLVGPRINMHNLRFSDQNDAHNWQRELLVQGCRSQVTRNEKQTVFDNPRRAAIASQLPCGHATPRCSSLMHRHWVC